MSTPTNPTSSTFKYYSSALASGAVKAFESSPFADGGFLDKLRDSDEDDDDDFASGGKNECASGDGGKGGRQVGGIILKNSSNNDRTILPGTDRYNLTSDVAAIVTAQPSTVSSSSKPSAPPLHLDAIKSDLLSSLEEPDLAGGINDPVGPQTSSFVNSKDDENVVC
eukprot:CAMPEP_0118659220 /NCGR_PEP_ID=MMETSP0785-20121206/14993_1 /TAXON_ID=91992 /ORGANISM="Bolidomonas pacifica, Strain CCMP 1866" /LENGTH=166 /DNA_ID=CAMNT_0006552305 /DNA_START=112 /DNA_END=609 /DNA_ORIENTATION=+